MSIHIQGPWRTDAAGGFPLDIHDQDNVLVARVQPSPAAHNVARRIVACVNALNGLPQIALDGGWTAAGICAHAKRVEVERDGANERAGLLLKAKDEWAERARVAEAERDQLRAEVEALRDAAKFASVVMGVVAENGLLAEVERRSLLCEVRRCDSALGAKAGAA